MIRVAAILGALALALVRPVQVTLADGTTAVVTVCKAA